MGLKTAFPYLPPVSEGVHRTLNRAALNSSHTLFEQRQYLESFHQLLDSLGENLRTRYGNADGTEFHIPHGSVVVDIAITEEQLDLSVDFLRVPTGGSRVAMLREVAELNNNRLMLAHFKLEEDKLKIVYRCPLSEAHPIKLLDTLRNICSVGDRFDDELCTKFGATRCYEPKVTPYSPEAMAQAHEGLRTICAFALQAIKEYNAVRQYGKSWFVMSLAMFQLGYFLNPQGQLINDLQQALNDSDEDLPVEELVSQGVRFLEDALGKSQQELANDLYVVDALVPRQGRTLAQAKEWLKGDYEDCTSALQSGDHEQVVIRLTKDIYHALFYVEFPEPVVTILVQALEQAAEKPLEEAAQILYEAESRIFDEDFEDNDDALQALPEGLGQQLAQAASAQLEQAQEQLQSTMDTQEMAQLQQDMALAMQQGNMAEYMRLAMEMQQRMMSSFLGAKQE